MPAPTTQTSAGRTTTRAADAANASRAHVADAADAAETVGRRRRISWRRASVIEVSSCQGWRWKMAPPSRCWWTSSGYSRKLHPCRGWRHAGQRRKAGAEADHPRLPAQIEQLSGGESRPTHHHEQSAARDGWSAARLAETLPIFDVNWPQLPRGPFGPPPDWSSRRATPQGAVEARLPRPQSHA